MTHLCLKIQDAQCLLVQQGSSSSKYVLTNTFPQGYQLLASMNSNLSTSYQGNHEWDNSSNVFMVSSHVNVAMRACDYGEEETSKDKSIPKTMDPLHIERPSIESIPRILKGSTKRTTINPNARPAQNYLIVEDLAQSPCAMSGLEVLQSCPSQISAFLLAMGALDPKNSLTLTFDMINVKTRLPRHKAFQIKFVY